MGKALSSNIAVYASIIGSDNEENALINLPARFEERPFHEWNDLVRGLHDLWELSGELGLQRRFEELLLLKEGQRLVDLMSSNNSSETIDSCIVVNWHTMPENQNLFVICMIEVVRREA